MVETEEDYEEIKCVDMFAYWRRVKAEAMARGKVLGKAEGRFEQAKNRHLKCCTYQDPLMR